MINVQGGYEFAASESGLKLNVKDVTATDLALHGPDQPADDVKLAKLSDHEYALRSATAASRCREVEPVRRRIARAARRAGKHQPAGAARRQRIRARGGRPRRRRAPAQAQAAPPWVLSAPDIAIEAASLDVEDGLVKPAATFRLDPIDVKVSGYSNAPGTQVQVDANRRHRWQGEAGRQGPGGAGYAGAGHARGHRRFRSRLAAALSRRRTRR